MPGQTHLPMSRGAQGIDRMAPDLRQAEIRLTAATGIGDVTRRLGGDPARLLHKYGSLSRQPQIGTATMPLCDYTQLLEEAAAMTGNEHFGLEFGESFQMVDLGPIGYLLVHARTVREGLQLFARHFQDLQENSGISLEVTGDLARIVYRIDDPRIRHRRQDAEFTLGMLNATLHRLIGAAWRLFRVDFTHIPPARDRQHAQYFHCDVEFQRRETALVFERDLLELPLPSPDPLLVEHLESYFVRRRASRGAKPSLAEVVARQLAADIRDGHAPRLIDIACLIGISERALNRGLAEEGTNFRRMLLDCRIAAATRLLRDTAMPLTQIAFEVGYSDATAFSRAFRQQTKLAPQNWRKQVTTTADK